MFEFIKEYIKHPSKVGAVAPSSKYLATSMIKSVNFEKCNCIVEYGPGTGVFTKEIINRKKKHTLFLIIEQNEMFYNDLVKQYSHLPEVKVIHGVAQDIDMYLKEFHVDSVDYIVSGLPFTSLPKEVSSSILEKTKDVIGTKGKFITFQYSKLKQNLFKQYFLVKESNREYRNLPPAYVLVMENERM